MLARALLIGLTAALLSVPASGQVARYDFFGSGCPTTVVPFSVEGTPRLGATFRVRAHPPVVTQFFRRSAVIIVGSSDTGWGAVTLPFSTAPLSQPGLLFCGDLLVSIDAMVPVPINATGAATTAVPFRVPAHPSFLGALFYQQVMQINVERGGGTSVSFSNGGRGRIGI